MKNQKKLCLLEKKFINRFDYDFNFGVVANKFIVKSIQNKKIEIYGKGKQKKELNK